MVGLSGPEGLSALGGWPGVLAKVAARSDLEADEAEAVMGEVLEGRAAPVPLAALLLALRTKGETPKEITGFVAAMYRRAETLELAGSPLDVVGTGGDRLGSINVSTLAALIAAGAGAPVCKHGGRAASSPVGTADVLEALGVAVELGPAGVAACLKRANVAFCFAPRFHPAMRHAAAVRRELAVPTVFNFLGPLAHPGRAPFRLVGVSDPAMAETMARVLGAVGCRRAMVAFADDGLDELSVTSPTTVLEVEGDGAGAFELRRRRLEPEDAGLTRWPMASLRGGDAAFNASAIRRVLDGEAGGPRDIGLLNAAAALVVAGRAGDLVQGVEAARASVDEGRAAEALERLVEISSAEAAKEATPAS